MNKSSDNNAMSGKTKTVNQSRRNFLVKTGGAALLAGGLAGCSKFGDYFPHHHGGGNGATVDLGKGDYGILNYAYALEQLEAAFYTKVIASPYHGCSGDELALLKDIRDHEIAHREFFKNALGSNAIKGLEVDFSTINFGSRDSVLGTAKAFEDLGVSAYNGAGKLIANGDYLTIAGKIVSVEARHAAFIRDLISNGSFADSTVIDMNGLDMSKDPADVLAIANTFLKTKVSGNNLPTS
ncbi:MAG: ferritin-like domain-containing protein [Chitinophagaceae bacterium]